MGLVAGRTLKLQADGATQLTLSVVEETPAALEDMLARTRRWASRSGRDLVEELHQRRREERRHEEVARGLRRD